jgi:hypothetical protein
MVAAYIFILHFIAAGYGFFTRKKTGGLSEGLLAVAFVGIVFAIGWTIATMLTNLLFTPQFFIKWYYHQTDSQFLRTLRKEINRDTISLLILSCGEIGFYYLFLSEHHEVGKPGATEKKEESGQEKR